MQKNNKVKNNVLNKPFKHDKSRYDVIEKNGWILIRFQKHSILRQDLVRGGIELIPKVLWGVNKKGEYKEDKKGYWYKNCPTPNDIKLRSLNDSIWFQKKRSNNKKVSFQMRNYYSKLLQKIKSDGLSYDDCLNELSIAKEWLTKLRPYTCLSHFIIDRIIDEYYTILKKFVPQKLLVNYFISLFLIRSPKRKYYQQLASIIPPVMLYDYFREALIENYKERLAKANIIPIKTMHDFVFPPPSLPSKISQLNFNKKRPLLPKQIRILLKKQNVQTQKTVSRYSILLPQIINLTEEHAYTYRTFMISINHILEKIAIHLIKNHQIKTIDSVVNYTVNEIIAKSKCPIKTK